MKVNPDDYRVQKEPFLAFLERSKGRTSREWLISEYAAISFTPLVCLYHFFGEEFGYDQELLNDIKRLEGFYK